MTKCKHEAFHVAANIHGFEDTGGFLAEIRINCRQCGHPFQFMGLELGLNLNGAAMDVDGQEARLAIAPVGEIPQPLDKGLVSGFRVKQPGDH